MDVVLEEIENKMHKVLDFLYQELKSIRTGRVNVSILDFIKVDCYGEKMPLNQVANISVADAFTLIIDPWDKGSIREIEKAIDKSDLHVTPSNDGVIVRLNFPILTQERRLEMTKMVKKKTEESKVVIRNIRRDGNEKIKKSEKEKIFSEDDSKRAQDKIQQRTDHYIQKIDEAYHHKEKEILEIS